MQQSLAEKYGSPVPRYTSYPTAPHFHEGVDEEKYRQWLKGLKGTDTLSLYLHVPFCDRLCWFCGCHTKQTLKYAPITTYIEQLLAEIDLVAAAIENKPKVTGVHFGGGSPSMLTPDDLGRLVARLREKFSFGDRPEISIEVDPGDVTPERVEGMVKAGLSRVSIGVQDFDEKVQEAINRPQSFELTRNVVEQMRGAGVHSLNLDVLYGLPYQTEDTLRKTIEQVVLLKPDRVALFGYAHVPWMKKHQNLIEEDKLADINGRFSQAQLAAQLLVNAGFVRIGLDHFARFDDTLAVAARTGRLRRNFQGYTDDPASALIGLGASSIGETKQGYVQNIVGTGRYMEEVKAGKIPVARGVELSQEDIARRWVIESLMCDMVLARAEAIKHLGDEAAGLLAEAAQLAERDEDGLFVAEDDGFRVTETGRPFVRVLAAHFDTYLNKGKGRHSAAI
ncbi:Coproporphyrinogen III oxidase, oxygen-independent [hydrothermal vent metagenome]|uniref:coproporphyrinogen dehydrogenase n=1 Tax=hydrothermal vent metagenome TaxID=652676 RepID=A0A3B0UCH8_9ZZZZ